MWLLLIVLLTSVQGLPQEKVLETYAAFEECQIERNRVGFAMAEAYPWERDFVIECRVKV